MRADAIALFGKVERASYFERVAPELHVERPPPWPEPSVVDPSAARETLAVDGWFSVDSVLRDDEVAALANAIERLEADHVPALFVFAYDEAWLAVERIRRAVAAIIDAPCAVVADVWAWRIAPTKGARGWVPHRGTYVDNRVGGKPSLINAWIALSDVTVETACMHVLPASRDPNFGGDLRSTHHNALDALALPARPGNLLGWSSNLLHWGGAMSPTASRARLSLSVTLSCSAAVDALAQDAQPTMRERLDLIADLADAYGYLETSAFDATREWARVTRTTRALGSRR